MSADYAQGILWRNFADVSCIPVLLLLAPVNRFLLWLYASTVTNIPLETSPSGPDGLGGPSSARPAWIRPVRKKAPSIARSNQSNSGDSPSHHSSPEAFSPSDFFAEPMNVGVGVVKTSPTPSAMTSTYATMGIDAVMRDDEQLHPQHLHSMQQPQHLNPHNQHPHQHMYMSTGDMMAFFNDGGV